LAGDQVAIRRDVVDLMVVLEGEARRGRPQAREFAHRLRSLVEPVVPFEERSDRSGSSRVRIRPIAHLRRQGSLSVDQERAADDIEQAALIWSGGGMIRNVDPGRLCVDGGYLRAIEPQFCHRDARPILQRVGRWVDAMQLLAPLTGKRRSESPLVLALSIIVGQVPTRVAERDLGLKNGSVSKELSNYLTLYLTLSATSRGQQT